MAAPDRSDSAVLQQLTDLPIVSAQHCRWGFENRTDRALLDDGRCVIVQRLTNASLAARRFELTRRLHLPLAQVGIAVPFQLHADASASPPFAVYDCLPGDPANSWLASDSGAQALAAGMGALLPRLAQVAVGSLDLPDDWADPRRLRRQAETWLTTAVPFLTPDTTAMLVEHVDQIAASSDSGTACFAHGDFCPVNALVDEHRVTALVDLEFARLAPPLFDAAWWGWVVRYHHPERWVTAWPVLLKAAGIGDTTAVRRQARLLHILRLLEFVSESVAFNPERARFWAARLTTTLEWDL